MTSAANSQSSQALFREIEAERPYLLRYALAKLRESDAAEEVVQEALLAALNGCDGFACTSTLRTWLTSILKFKIVDYQRRAVAERAHIAAAPEGDGADDPDWYDNLFDHTGHWRQKFEDWSMPDSALTQKQFFEVFERCMDKLPKATSRVFFQREVIGLETEEICKDENISSSNCWVMLHRARVALRECLDKHWFSGVHP